MCLLFLHINDSCGKDEFRLILVNNRDEFWRRPTETAKFWGQNQSCISGLDLEPGKEGGTWFGASALGRIACLVNLSGQSDPAKKGRGFLVSDFLTTADTTESFSRQISAQRDDYNGFILTLIELGNTSSQVVHITNDRLADAAILHTQPTANAVYAIGNSSLKFPWRKVCEGQERFAQIVQNLQKVSTKDLLKEELFQMMADKSRYWPDSVLERQGKECGWGLESTKAVSAMFVWDPKREFGTRTTTLLLIDGHGNCDYAERTLHIPVNIDIPQWSSVHHSYKLHF